MREKKNKISKLSKAVRKNNAKKSASKRSLTRKFNIDNDLDLLEMTRDVDNIDELREITEYLLYCIAREQIAKDSMTGIIDGYIELLKLYDDNLPREYIKDVEELFDETDKESFDVPEHVDIDEWFKN